MYLEEERKTFRFTAIAIICVLVFVSAVLFFPWDIFSSERVGSADSAGDLVGNAITVLGDGFSVDGITSSGFFLDFSQGAQAIVSSAGAWDVNARRIDDFGVELKLGVGVKIASLGSRVFSSVTPADCTSLTTYAPSISHQLLNQANAYCLKRGNEYSKFLASTYSSCNFGLSCIRLGKIDFKSFGIIEAPVCTNCIIPGTVAPGDFNVLHNPITNDLDVTVLKSSAAREIPLFTTAYISTDAGAHWLPFSLNFANPLFYTFDNPDVNDDWVNTADGAVSDGDPIGDTGSINPLVQHSTQLSNLGNYIALYFCGCDTGDCELQSNWFCPLQPGIAGGKWVTQRIPFCSDDFQDLGEACDDGNLADADGCDQDCVLEAVVGWTCPLQDYGKNNGCDCGCGAVDPDCKDTSGAQSSEINLCNFCGRAGSCSAIPGDTTNAGDCTLLDPLIGNNICVECGNGETQATEECDDGNQDTTDDCTNACTSAVCGDGFTQAGVETCDDGNTVDTDACTNACVPAVCGDGIEHIGVEECDDGVDVNGNQNDFDACTNQCTDAVCGDDSLFAGVEVCDDGNLLNNDLCSDTCIDTFCGDNFEQTPNADGVTELCDDGNLNDIFPNCNALCTAATSATCGNGVPEAPEVCDDGNQDNTDACTNVCTAAVCGDGFTQAGETCDDGNQDNTDACTNVCTAVVCGDGFTQVGEQCDDGNKIETDDCRNSCILPTCGDGVTHAGHENCDDGNQLENDACMNSCNLAVCGDGIIRTGVEQCDDNNNVNTDACVMFCRAARCGDGFVQANSAEVCDDGNTIEGDGCQNSCVLTQCTSNAVCGAGNICQGGVCQSAPTASLCSADSDEGAYNSEPHTKGRVTLLGGVLVEDYCTDFTYFDQGPALTLAYGNLMYEQKCIGGQHQTLVYACACNDGACTDLTGGVPDPNGVCQDTDNGVVLNVQGTQRFLFANWFTDYCSWTGPNFPTGTNPVLNTMREFQCDTVGLPQQTFVNCNCQNGRCI